MALPQLKWLYCSFRDTLALNNNNKRSFVNSFRTATGRQFTVVAGVCCFFPLNFFLSTLSELSSVYECQFPVDWCHVWLSAILFSWLANDLFLHTTNCLNFLIHILCKELKKKEEKNTHTYRPHNNEMRVFGPVWAERFIVIFQRYRGGKIVRKRTGEKRERFVFQMHSFFSALLINFQIFALIRND